MFPRVSCGARGSARDPRRGIYGHGTRQTGFPTSNCPTACVATIRPWPENTRRVEPGSEGTSRNSCLPVVCSTSVVSLSHGPVHLSRAHRRRSSSWSRSFRTRRAPSDPPLRWVYKFGCRGGPDRPVTLRSSKRFLRRRSGKTR